MNALAICFLVLTAILLVPVVFCLRDQGNWEIASPRTFFGFWLPIQIIAGLWCLASCKLFMMD